LDGATYTGDAIMSVSDIGDGLGRGIFIVGIIAGVLILAAFVLIIRGKRK
jgi:hypothetical protein